VSAPIIYLRVYSQSRGKRQSSGVLQSLLAAFGGGDGVGWGTAPTPRLRAAALNHPAHIPKNATARLDTILYPSLRVKFAQDKREVMGDLPPRPFDPVRMETENLQIHSDLSSHLTTESNGLAKFGAKGSIGTFKK
jgi:hypothetical protein